MSPEWGPDPMPDASIGRIARAMRKYTYRPEPIRMNIIVTCRWGVHVMARHANYNSYVHHRTAALAAYYRHEKIHMSKVWKVQT